MAIRGIVAALLPKFLLRFAQRLRFPQLFLLCLILFVIDLFIPDLTLIDELFFASLTLLFASWKNRHSLPESDKHG